MPSSACKNKRPRHRRRADRRRRRATRRARAPLNGPIVNHVGPAYANYTASIFIFKAYLHHQDLHSFPTRRSSDLTMFPLRVGIECVDGVIAATTPKGVYSSNVIPWSQQRSRSEEHTSELQSHSDVVCRLLLVKINDLDTGGEQTVDVAGLLAEPARR